MALKIGRMFSRRSADPLGDHELVGLLEPGIEFEGKITVSSGLIRLNTHIKGEVDCAGAVVIVDQGEVEGEIRSSFISIAGKVKGTIRALEKVEIKANGIVLGNIHTAELVIEPGGYFDGECHMPVPDLDYRTTEKAGAENKS